MVNEHATTYLGFRGGGPKYLVDFETRGIKMLVWKNEISKVNNFENMGIKIAIKPIKNII